ncbi:MAG: PSD1 and planctomycete cytochrome C domain-containing protein [Opitutus sp.]
MTARNIREAIGVIVLVLGSVPTAPAAEERISFNEHIRPILSENCFACHGRDEKKREAHRRLDTSDGATTERKGIRAIVPGNLEESDAWQRIVSNEEDEQMPPVDSHKEPLTAEQRQLIKRWIEQGAVYQEHWAYEPIVAPPLPKDSGRVGSHPIDRFVAEKLATKGLRFAPEAPKEILLRRATLDLTGLPPTIAEIDAFMADKSPSAYERAVDRLLGSPQYGEHIARSWLDAVRYGDTHGMHFDNARSIWPYRDWVVRAFNDNMPFDTFTIEQLAGDLLPNPTQSQLVATGYTRSQLSTNEGGAIADEVMMRMTNDRVDTTAAVWLGLTASCASCHDHKFDPLKQKEYYSLGAFFKGMADGAWDGNARVPGPFVVLANGEDQKRLDAIHRELPKRRAELSAKAEKLLATTPLPKPGPASYEVIWAEDGDVPLPAQSGQARIETAGTWRGGDGVPVVGGERALRLEGKVERVVNFAAGDVALVVSEGTKAFAYVNIDPTQPPQALSIELITTEAGVKRMIWGDPKAFGEGTAGAATVAGAKPIAGTYVRLEIEPMAAGMKAGTKFTGLRLLQSDGAAWWDHLGVACTTVDAAKDPLLSPDAWEKSFWNETAREAANMPYEITWRIRLPDYFQEAEDRKILEGYFRDFVYGPLRGALENESRAAREFMAEQVHLEKTLPVSLIAKERDTPRPAHVLIRGQYDKLGDPVEPGTPSFLPPLRVRDGGRATRLDLAQWLVSPENPLTARVAVNRFWQQLFGEGLVRTPGDFGAQGDPPTHLDLHNWLSAEFLRTRWDVKKLVRLIMTSRTYRQDSNVTPALLEVDPSNKWLARGPRVRLDGEVLRDQALAVGGLLVKTVGGPPRRPYQPENIWEPVAIADSTTRFYVQDHGDALYRRSLYTFWKRTAPPPAMTTFDAPSRESFCTRRGRSDTPLQALALMNDVQQFEAARAFAEQLLSTPGTDNQRLVLAFRSVASRAPAERERALLVEALATQRAHFTQDVDAARKVLTNGESKPTHDYPPAEFAAWTMLASIMLNLDETVTNR